MSALLDIKDLHVHFPVKKGILQRPKSYVKALNGVSLQVEKGETLGIVGESGCGKSTLARSIVGLQQPTSGDILLNGKNYSGAGAKELYQMRRNVQMIFQDPYTSLNPRMKAGESIAAPLKAYKKTERMQTRVKELLELVGLNPDQHFDKYPHEFSGGQRQRIGIARALALEPELIICDEPVSALDVSVQAQVVNLLQDLQKLLGLTYIFIAHDLSVISHMADQIAVMYLGKVMEKLDHHAFQNQVSHPYTQSLLSAVPFPDPVMERTRERIVLSGELPSPANPPSGCVFHTRCPRSTDRCRQETPALIKNETTGNEIACFHPVENEEYQAVDRERVLTF
ncbi:oligopeptide/dipeptide ABC transporter ATP-binding protein [Jeotgalibacillus haloalkalitolerans]|uniref:Oligopeptide/dipeptide ABC transporter ATP-binding protein n=1 Tax=Jeotgalibacillus haloalkalitolerans TaxID=3104292 RepID=A0ABU5KPV2_9BACL|nr:oligopeptide/dipeptide ABC transporter ATP-binding protein [Jeotgalibacillus sp. HH7-29]MDZ5712771.1 oligopeptide/dipeptide ABC transporter ATP-binding protein [Jeotgalibacillus sp. HH7-29]